MLHGSPSVRSSVRVTLAGLVALFVAVFASSPAAAAPSSQLQTSTARTQTVCDQYSGLTNWNRTGATAIKVAQFNPALGQLQSISVQRTITDVADLGSENKSPDVATITFRAKSTVWISAPGVVANLDYARDSGTITHNAVSPYDGTVDYTGPSGRRLQQPLDTKSDTVVPTDNTPYVGTGQVAFSAQATGENSTTNNTGNGATNIETLDTAKVCVTYNYLTSAVGDCVFHDIDRDGIQDAGEPGVSGISVTIYVKNTNNQVMQMQTGANGCYAFNDLPCGAYTVVFSGLPAGWVISPTNTGAPDIDSNGLSSSTDLTVCGIDPTIDLGIYDNNPKAVPPVVTPPTPTSVNSPTPIAVNATPRTTLSLRKVVVGTTTNFRRGSNVTFRIVVTNTGAVTARNVRICDALPKLLTFVRVGNASFENGAACWTGGNLAAGKSRSVTVVVRIDRNAPACSTPTNIGRASASNANLVQVRRSIRACAVTPGSTLAPAVTGLIRR